MIEIRVTAADGELSGSVSDLETVRAAIVRLINSTEQHITIAANVGAKPQPYDRCLAEIRLVRGSGPTCIKIAGIGLTVTGADENLARFSTWFRVQPGEHGHYEHFEGNEFISPESVPLVVAAR